jgi:hypothetical protein
MLKELMSATRKSQLESSPSVKNTIEKNKKYMKDSGDKGMRSYSNTGSKQNKV